jgi:hypothetical protein
MKQRAKSKKDFEAVRLGVFAIPGPLLAHLNCGIRTKSANRGASNEIKDEV